MIKQRYTPRRTGGANSTIPGGGDSDDGNSKYSHAAGSSPYRRLVAVVVALVLSIAFILSVFSIDGTEKGTKLERASTNGSMRLQPKHTARIEQGGTRRRSEGGLSSLRKVQVVTDSTLPPKLVGATYDDLWEHFDCDDYFEEAKRPTDHKPVWQKMRKAYIQSIKPEASVASRLLQEETGILVPYVVRNAEDKGLGIFATEKIAKGTVVDDTRRGGRVTFTKGDDFRRFLHALYTPNLACVAMRCSAVESSTGDTDPKLGAYISVDADDNCFMNNDREPNVGSLPGSDCPTTCDYAYRDIEAGEEILCNYGTYSYGDGWEWFGLTVQTKSSDESTKSEKESREETEGAESAENAESR